MKKFLTIEGALGYFTKPDKTQTNERYLVEGSQNVLINENERVSIRKGYTLKGVASTALNPIFSAFSFFTSGGSERNLRFANGILQFWDTNPETDLWVNLITGLSTTKPIRFGTWWDNTTKISLLLFVNNNSTLYEWSGAITILASATGTTITKQGTATWTATGFHTAGTREVIINGTTYAYTGGEGTTTLTGVTPDPSGEAANSTVVQAVRTNANTPASGFTNNFIEVLNNQVWIGSETSRLVYVSKNTSITDYTNSTPRVEGEGVTLTLDDVTSGFAIQEQDMYISSGKDHWYKSNFFKITVSTTLVENVTVKKIKTAPLQAARSQECITKIGNYVAFLSNEPALRLLGRIENLEDPQFQTLSNPIKPDFDAEDFDNASVFFNKNRIYVTAPDVGKVYINETVEDENGIVRRFWQPPQILPIRVFSVMDGALIGHSAGVTESYLMFDRTSDNGNTFTARASFAYRSFGNRMQEKSFDEYFVEGYIAPNTKLALKLNYDYAGFTQQIEKIINGADANGIIFEVFTDPSLGNIPLGDASLSDDSVVVTGNPKFRTIIQIPRYDFYELQTTFETDAQDYQWEILSQGPNAAFSPAQPVRIKR